MIEFSILVPIVRDDNKVSHPAWLWEQFEQRLLEFGGFTVGGIVGGCWKDSNGVVIKDISRQYRVAVEPNREQEVWSLIREFCPVFGQQCLYAAITSEHAHLCCPK